MSARDPGATPPDPTVTVPDAVPRPPSLLRRLAKWGLVVSAALVFVIVSVTLFLTATTAGARFVVSQGLQRAPMPVSIGSVDGALLGPLTLSEIEVENQGIVARVERVVFDWKPLQLLRRRVEIETLHVAGVDVLVPADYEPPPPDEETPPREGPIEIPELPVEIVLHDVRIEIARVVVEETAELGASTLAASGTLDAFELSLDVQGSAAQVQAFEGNASMRGAPDAYDLEGEVTITAGELPPVSATLTSSGSLSDIDVRELLVRTENGEARLQARAAWYPEVTWDASAEADVFSIAPFTPTPEEWPGQVSFSASTSGRMTEEGPAAVVTVEDLTGTVREQPLSGGLDLRTESATRIDLERMELAWGGLGLRAEGALLETLDLTFALSVPDLDLALPGATGTIRMDGSVQGARDAPHVVATFEADDVALATSRLAEARGDVDLDLAAGGRSDLRIVARGLVSGETAVDSVTLVGDGTREDHGVRMAAWMAENTLGVALSGGVVDRGTGAPPAGGGSAGGADAGGSSAPPASLAWSGALDSLQVVTDVAGSWSLAEPAALFAAADTASLAEACVTQLTASMCLGGGWKREGAAAGDLRIEGLPLGPMATNLPRGTTVEGSLEGEATFAMTPEGVLSADGTFGLEGGIEATVGAESARFGFGGDGLRLVIDDAGTRADVDFALEPEVGEGSFQATAHVELAGYNSTGIDPEAQPIEGRIEAGSEDLAFLAVFTPLLTDATGRLTLESDITGTVAAPEIRGSLLVEDGQADIPELGLELRDLQLRAEGSPEGGIDLEGSLQSGEGSFAMTGRSPAVPTAEAPAEIQLTGERFLAMNTPEIQVVIEPDLDIRYDGALTTVTGTLAIPWARVELVEIPEVAVPPSPDVVFVGEETPPPPEVDANVQVLVGDDVRFQGFGFNSFFEGDLQVREEPGNVPLVFGELNLIEGRFAAYGQNLDVDPGRVVFSGPGEDAALDVTALRTAQDGTIAGVIVTGSAITPDIEITSDPGMTDADALSYIIYGKSLSEGDPSQQQRVAGAAATLGANVLTTKLAGSVGLDEARIEGATRDQAELVAGKYLTPSVFVSYGFGLFNPSSTFKVKYLLSSSWALQAESGDANGGDVLYQIERGR